MAEWRQGRKVPQNVYDGDKPIAQFHDAATAAIVVSAVNECARLRSALREIADISVWAGSWAFDCDCATRIPQMGNIARAALSRRAARSAPESLKTEGEG